MDNLSDKRLTEEFDRLATLKGECEASMFEIRREKARRISAEIARLQDELDAINV